MGFIEHKLYPMAVVIGIYLIVLFVYRPYNSVFHNIVLVLNQIGVLLAFIWLILQKIIVISR